MNNKEAPNFKYQIPMEWLVDSGQYQQPKYNFYYRLTIGDVNSN